MMKIKKRLINFFFVMTLTMSLTGNAFAAEKEYVWPTASPYTISQNFHAGHKGIDVGVVIGTQVYAVAAGTVDIVYSGCNNVNGANYTKGGLPCSQKNICPPNNYGTGSYCNEGFGNGVVIKHDNGSYTAYAHLAPNTITVKVGQRVSQGQVIGKSGSSGCSGGPHLHFSMLAPSALDFWAAYRYGYSTDPMPYLTGKVNTTPVATTKGADTITETSAILRGEVRSFNGKITECGMYIGTSKDSLTLLGSDKGLSTYGTPCYYSTDKYKYPLKPGTTYYYQVYAVANGETAKGSVKSFVTEPIQTPTPTTDTVIDEVSPPEIPGIKLSTDMIDQGEKVGVSWEMESNVNYNVIYHRIGDMGSTTIAFAKSPVNISDLESGSYTVQVLASNKAGNVKSEEVTFTVKEKKKEENVGPIVTVMTKETDNITGSSATVRGDFSVTGGIASECGMYIGTTPSGMTKLGSDAISSAGVPFYYNTGKYGRTLTQGTTYYYQAYVIVDGKTYKGSVSSFITASTVTVTTKGADNITATDAIVRGQVVSTEGKATECGMYFGTSANNLTKLGSDKINANNMPFYYGTRKYGRTLTPGTTYYYRAYAIVGGTIYWGEIKSFTTAR